MKLKKQFGQHFLIDESISHKIVHSLIAKPSDNLLLEIGPGAGAITKYLGVQGWKDYKVVEIDDEKVSYLQDILHLPVEKIINKDFLRIDTPYDGPFIIIGNFPYNISSQILFKILDWRDQVMEVVGMFQKEVAVRVASDEGNKDYGILSVLIQAYYEVEYLIDVPPTAFNPPPKVMSGVIRLTRNFTKFDIEKPEKFHLLVKRAFAMRRKTLRNNLKGMIHQDKIPSYTLDLRAEQLSVADFVELYKIMYE